MQLSARNTFKGKILNVHLGDVEAEITLEVSPGVIITSVITHASAERLKLMTGMDAHAVIKASDVMIAVE